MTEPIRIELPTMYGMDSVNTYLFLEPVPTLIDCGEKSDANWEALKKALAAHNLLISDIKRIIVTHAHVDHMGMVAKVAKAGNAEVWVNEYCYEWAINCQDLWKHRIHMMRKHLVDDMPAGENAKKMSQILNVFTNVVIGAWDNIPKELLKIFPVDGRINIGGEDWEVIYAPGHSNSQTCFYHKEKKWMLAGDAILKITPTPIIEFSRTNPDIRENSLAIMLNTLEKLAAMDISKVFPGHYEPFDNHQKLIAFQLARIAMRKEETFKLIKEGKNRFFDLFDTLYTNRMNIPGMAMLRGYLDLLIEEKRIEAKTVDNFTAYVAIS